MTRVEYLQRRFEFVRRGAELPQTKLTPEDVRHIRELHAFKQAEIKRLNETLSYDAIAEKFDVSPGTIDKIVRFITWRHVV